MIVLCLYLCLYVCLFAIIKTRSSNFPELLMMMLVARSPASEVGPSRIIQLFHLLGNKGPKATYESQNTIYNNHSPRQCIQ